MSDAPSAHRSDWLTSNRKTGPDDRPLLVHVLDGRGNVVALTDSTGNVVNRHSYDVWGGLTSVSESVPQRLRYAGYWYDQELGWYRISVRMYDPSLKRWLQPDLSQAEGARTYVYVGDDPIIGDVLAGRRLQGLRPTQ